MNEKKGLTAEEVEIVRIGIEAFFKYANGLIVYQKIRSGEFGMTEEEKKIEPLVTAARKLLGIGDD